MLNLSAGYGVVYEKPDFPLYFLVASGVSFFVWAIFYALSKIK